MENAVTNGENEEQRVVLLRNHTVNQHTREKGHHGGENLYQKRGGDNPRNEIPLLQNLPEESRNSSGLGLSWLEGLCWLEDESHAGECLAKFRHRNGTAALGRVHAIDSNASESLKKNKVRKLPIENRPCRQILQIPDLEANSPALQS